MPDSTDTSPLLVALGSDAQALRLIHAGFWSVREAGRPWVAVHVEVPGEAEAETSDQARLWLEEAQSLGAETLWIQARTLVQGIQEAVRRTGAEEVMLGKGSGRWLWSRLGHSSAQELQRRLPGLRITPVFLGPEMPPSPIAPPRDQWAGAFFGALGILGACTGLGAILPPELPLPAIFLLYLLATALIAQRWGLLVGALSVAASAVIFDLVFDSVQGSLQVGNWPLLALFLVILMGGQVAVALAERLAHQTRNSRRRAALLAALLMLGRNLNRATGPQGIAEVLAHVGERLLHRRIHLLLPRTDGAWQTLPLGPAPPEAPPLDPETFPRTGELQPVFKGGFAFLPLGHGEALEGILAVEVDTQRDLDEDGWELLRAFTVQVAIALERVRWFETAQQTRLENETERMRSALLGAISHDLRTPLAGIQGAASTLLLASETLEPSTRSDLLTMIHDESERLNQLLANLLDLTSLESGVIRVQKEWQPLEEVIGAALRHAEAGHGNLQVELELPEDLPLVPVDGALLEQLLINLLLNAQRHAPESPVTLRAWVASDTLELAISDRGPGIPEALRERIFEKFFQLPGSRGEGGVGLGLAICDAIARAHGGRIWARARREGQGTAFRLSLPLEGVPPTLPLDEEPLP